MLIKGNLNHTWCPQKENEHILVEKLRYMDMIKILVKLKKFRYMNMIKISGLLKSFTFAILSFLGAFFKNGSTKLIKGYFSPTGCQK